MRDRLIRLAVWRWSPTIFLTTITLASLWLRPNSCTTPSVWVYIVPVVVFVVFWIFLARSVRR